jgi:hypothetical protein
MHLEKQSVNGSIDVVKHGKMVLSTQENVGEPVTGPSTANVGFTASFTKNLGNYESVKVTVSLFYPVAVSPTGWEPEVLNAVMDKVQQWVDDRMTKTLGTVETST